MSKKWPLPLRGSQTPEKRNQGKEAKQGAGGSEVGITEATTSDRHLQGQTRSWILSCSYSPTCHLTTGLSLSLAGISSAGNLGVS